MRGKLNTEDQSLDSILSSLRQRLAPVSDTPTLDAQVLLAFILGKPRAWVLAHPEAVLTNEQRQNLQKASTRLEQGEPLPYILGHWEFFGLDFILTPATLIPRPETELLVEQALLWLEAHPKQRMAADVGAGSGCIAVALAAHVPDLHIIATDLSHQALQATNLNAHRHNVAGRVWLAQADLLPGLACPLDLVCANLPYIPTSTLQSLPIYGREPNLALDGGPDGLAVIGRLLDVAPYFMASTGLLLLEIEASQGEAAQQLALKAFQCAQVQVVQDLAGNDRMLRIEL